MNPYKLALTAPSKLRVYQFHHPGKGEADCIDSFPGVRPAGCASQPDHLVRATDIELGCRLYAADIRAREAPLASFVFPGAQTCNRRRKPASLRLDRVQEARPGGCDPDATRVITSLRGIVRKCAKTAIYHHRLSNRI